MRSLVNQRDSEDAALELLPWAIRDIRRPGNADPAFTALYDRPWWIP